jgi:3-methylfumaryl-CoA hydratase
MFAGGRLSAPGTVRVGERLDLTQRVTASADKQGRSGPLRFRTTESVFRRPDGDVVLVEEQDIVYRAAGAPSARRAGTPASEGPGRLLTRLGEPLRAVLRADAVALQRFPPPPPTRTGSTTTIRTSPRSRGIRAWSCTARCCCCPCWS